MQSPVSPTDSLQSKEIEPGLHAYECPVSGGVWIPLESYMTWRNKHLQETNPTQASYAPAPMDDSKQKALLCPESGCLLTRYRVGRGLQFHIDRSPVTGGVF